MKYFMMIVLCVMMFVIGMSQTYGEDKSYINNALFTENIEHRVIVPYPVNPPSKYPMEIMPQLEDNDRLNIWPYIRIGPTPDGGIGTELILRFGIFRPHGLNLDLNLF